MKKKTILFGSILAAFLMLMMPGISATNNQLIEENLESLESNERLPWGMRMILVGMGIGMVKVGFDGMINGFAFQEPDGFDFFSGIVTIGLGFYVAGMGLLGYDPLNKLDG
ncbi:MAG: hypothetical protein JSW62_03115 [Thermoplasmatales archaeon]|nr:MAG: hypothetical protein JSW62_03115 [Thermoplasmatales archaeon]